MATEDLFHYTSLGPSTAPNIRKLADLKPKMLATMHGASFAGDTASALRALADHYETRLRAAVGQVAGHAAPAHPRDWFGSHGAACASTGSVGFSDVAEKA